VLQKLATEVKGLKGNLTTYDERIASIDNIVRTDKDELQTLKEGSEKYEQDIASLKGSIDANSDAIMLLKDALAESEQVKNSINVMDSKINSLRDSLNKYDEEIDATLEERLLEVLDSEARHAPERRVARARELLVRPLYDAGHVLRRAQEPRAPLALDGLEPLGRPLAPVACALHCLLALVQAVDDAAELLHGLEVRRELAELLLGEEIEPSCR